MLVVPLHYTEPDAVHEKATAARRVELYIQQGGLSAVPLSPHAAFYSSDSLVDLRTKAVETAITLFDTGRLINCVNAGLINEAKQKARAELNKTGGKQ